MARKRNTDASHKPIEQYDHKDKDRLNNPPVGLVDAHTDNGGQKRKTYQYDPHLDPQLQWAGKAEHTSFEVPTVSLHVHERIDPRRIIKTVQKDEIFGKENLVSQITLKKAGTATTIHLSNISDYLLFYAKDKNRLKYRQLFED